MATLPPSTDFTGGSVTQGGFKTAISTLRTFIADLLGTDSADKTAARAALGARGTADDVTLVAGKVVIFEGATDDAFETTLTVVDPTADQTITLPNMTGQAKVQTRGTDIASAATINLTTATGDIVDVTGTTAITAITLADGLERQVRFTGALTLTNGASLILPGGANITTAAGDFAVFRGYAAGVVRCVSYTKASGQPVVGGGVGQSMVRLNTANGYGSTNTKIRRFTNTVTNTGSDITYADSAANGASFTINTNGVYAVSFSDNLSSGDYIGLSLNTSSPTTGIGGLATSEVLSISSVPSAGVNNGYVGWTGYLPAGSVVRPHTSGVTSGGAPDRAQFTITRVG